MIWHTYAFDSITLQTADSRYLKLTGGVEIGLVSFPAGLSASTIYNGGTLSLPSTTTTLYVPAVNPSAVKKSLPVVVTPLKV